MKHSISLTLCLALAFSYNAASADKLYKWVDNKGVTHFSEHPPLNKPNEVIQPKTGHSDPVSYPTSTSASSAGTVDPRAKAEADSKAALKDPERCASATKNVATLKTYARIKVKGENGGFRYLTPDEHQQKLNDATKVRAESCQ